VRASFELGGTVIKPGTQAEIQLRVPDLYTNNSMYCDVYVIHGRKPGPVLFVSATIHGDEINGIEIIRRVLNTKAVNRISGTIIAVPVVNIFGFISKSRYLPDRRDLNRSFPGSEKGSLAGRLAHLFLTEIVAKSTHGVDLHTAAVHRDNLPQIRAVIDDPETYRMANAFNAPVIVNTSVLDGTLRHSAYELGIPVIVYEAGEALRFDEASIRGGVKGVIGVMRELGMMPKTLKVPKSKSAFVARTSIWVRAPRSGILRANKTLGLKVEEGEVLGVVSDPLGNVEEPILSPTQGIIIGRTTIPLVNEGEALFHIARFKNTETVMGSVEDYQNEMDPANDSSPSSEVPIV
jgi:predicted deacylase